MAWSERVRVVERIRRNPFTGAEPTSDGWYVEVRLTGDGFPEVWSWPGTAGIFGPVTLVLALDDASERFDSRADATVAAERLVSALDAATVAL